MQTDEAAEGLRIALARIAQEAEKRSGFLDLGRLGLTALPEELFGLRHLRYLNLGWAMSDQNGEWRLAACDIAPNDFGIELEHLAELPELQALSLSMAHLHDLSPLAGITTLQFLDCSRSRIADLSPLSDHVGLQSLCCYATKVTDLSPLSGLRNLKTLSCFNTQIADLSPLSSLTGLQWLRCGGNDTGIADLSPLSSLTALQYLGISHAHVTNLSPISGLLKLRNLSCDQTAVVDLSPLSGLIELQSLFCVGTKIADLSPLSTLTSLQSLYCFHTQVFDLSPLSRLLGLRILYCSNTQIADLSPLSGLVELQTLDCSSSRVTDLRPLAGLANLQKLNCSNTRVTDLSPLSGLDNLQSLKISRCSLTRIAEGFWNKPSLQELCLGQTNIPGVPAEALSQDWNFNCLHRLRAHLRDLEAGSETLPDVKLMVLGNGRVGKTQICRRLRGEDYDDSVASTHGILISAASLRDSGGAEWARLQAWDFGGQEIYHGTHALFLKTRAVFLIVWATETENQESHEPGGMVFRNHPLGYWLAYVRHLAGPDSAVVVVQTRCDRPEDEARRLPVEDADSEGLPFFKVVQFSSLKNRGRAALDEALREAVDWLWQRQGRVLIGAGRLRVRRRLEALREAEAQMPAHERQYRTLSQEHFRQLCAEAGGVSSPEHLLDYLHQCGVVFYRAGLFGERIVLDQGWALEAIYTLFHREKCYRELKRLGGRFTRSLLDMLVWQEHSADEQRLFLDMMQSCGLCFTHKPADEDVEAEYIAPDLLPARAEVEVELEHWGIGEADASAVYRYALHQPGLLRSLMAEIGQQAGVNGLYWRDGVCVYERETRSHAVIEQESLGDWRGVIRISTHGGRAAELLGRLRERLEAQNRQWGLQAVEEPAATVAEKGGLEARAPSLAFVQPPQPGLEYCVSYAHSDASPAGVARGEVVERLCELAEAKGVHILRDREDLALGERLSAFMRRIGQGDRVFVIISDKYLKSPNCMYELFEIWRVSRQESEDFLHRVRIYSTECAKFSTPRERLGYALHWKQEHEALRAAIQEHGAEILGVEDFRAFKRMDEFARHVGDILATVADVIHARRFEDLEAYGFDEA